MSYTIPVVAVGSHTYSHMLYDTQIHCITTHWKKVFGTWFIYHIWKILKIVPPKAQAQNMIHT